MTIEQAAYVDEETIKVVIDGKPFFVPDNMSNSERRQLAEWEAEGNTIPPYVAPALAPPPLSRRQLLLGLLAIGITSDMVEAEIGLIADPQERAASLIEWQAAGLYERDHPLVDQLAASFSLPTDQVDDLWVWASGL